MRANLLHTPDGVRDLYGDELSLKRSTEEMIHKLFMSYGYQEIQTPTFEYFDMFSSKIGTTASKELYKFFDKEGDTLVLRPDFTPSIARCAAKYYRDETIPVRFAYRGSAFINSNLLQGKLKETTQMGVELIGDSSVQADAEMIGLCVQALLDAGLTQFQISIGNVEFMKGLCEEAGLDEETEALLRDAISIKNFFGAAELLKNAGCSEYFIETLMKLSEMYDASSLDVWENTQLNARSLSAIQRLKELHKVLDLMGVSTYVSYDLGMVSKYHYYTGMIFKAYTYGVGDAIVKGGRYDSLLATFDKDAPATGFVILIDDLATALKYAGLHVEEAPVTMLLYAEADLTAAITKADEMRRSGMRVAMTSYSDADAEKQMQEAFKKNGYQVVVL